MASPTRSTALLSLALAAGGTAAWLLSYGSAPPTFGDSPPQPSAWHGISALLNLGLTLICLSRRGFRPLAAFFVPFAADSLDYLVLPWLGALFLPSGLRTAGDKFGLDALHFSLEIGLYLLAFLPVFEGREGRLRRPRRKSGILSAALFPAPEDGSKRALVRPALVVAYLIHLGVFAWLIVGATRDRPLPPELIRDNWPWLLLIPFLVALLNEIPFRGILPDAIRRQTGSWFAGFAIPALVWALYHAFFGEGMPVGLAGFGISLFGAVCYQALTDEFGTLWPAIASHSILEVFALFSLYGALS